MAVLLAGVMPAGVARGQSASEGPAAVTEGGLVKASIAGRKLILPALTYDGAPYVSLRAAAAALGGVLKVGKRAGDAILTIAGQQLSFAADFPGFVTHGSGAASLSHPVHATPGDLLVPVDFLSRVLAPLVEKTIQTAPATASAGVSGSLDVSIVGGKDTLRLVFECRQPVGWKLEETATELLLKLDGKAGEPPWASRAIGTPILRSMAFEVPAAGAAGLVVHLVKGDAFAHATASEMKNPFRIVLELQAAAGARIGEAASGTPVAARGLKTIVLDPGHGGEQKGAEGSDGLLEKEITLDVARKLQDMLRQEGLAVILTRTEDADLPLIERTAVANREKAGLFVSIHVNSSPRPQARGAETYYLAYQAADKESGALAEAENAAAGSESPGSRAGTDMILWDLAQSEHLRESSELAEIVQKSLNEALGIRDRGVKQAPFRVLMGADMPAVLVEIGFLSHPEEEAALKTPEYREKIAAGLHQALMEFKRNFDRRAGASAP
jgi:N-acetylmuramoyl-L-alanine amidase